VDPLRDRCKADRPATMFAAARQSHSRVHRRSSSMRALSDNSLAHCKLIWRRTIVNI
jgi:hypothetical protein